MRKFYLFYGLFALLCSPAQAETYCEPLSKDTAPRLAKYVHDKLDFPQTVTLAIDKVDPIGSTCFRRLQLHPRKQICLVLVK